MDDLPENASPGNRRSIPRTDLLLADPRIQAAEGRLGRPLVKAADRAGPGAGAERGDRHRPGHGRRRRRGRAPGDRRVDRRRAQRDRRPRPHQPRPRPAEPGRPRRRWPPPPGPATSNSTWPPGPGPGSAGTARSARCGRPCRTRRRRAWSTTTPPPSSWPPPSLAAGREIIISRGELIEIGDRFRLPDLLTSTGARLTEVGTTNRTTVADYEQAITADTAMILKVHPSNYKVEGFTKSAAVGELAALGVPLVHDIGSGLLAPHPLLPDEPDAATSLRRRREPGHRQRRQAPRGPAGRPAAGRRAAGPPPAAAPAGPGAAGRQADPGRPRGDDRRPAAARRPRRWPQIKGSSTIAANGP